MKKIALILALTLLSSTAWAGDSTGYTQPDVPWQKPWARQADTAATATNAEKLGGKNEAELDVKSAQSVGGTTMKNCTIPSSAFPPLYDHGLKPGTVIVPGTVGTVIGNCDSSMQNCSNSHFICKVNGVIGYF